MSRSTTKDGNVAHSPVGATQSITPLAETRHPQHRRCAPTRTITVRPRSLPACLTPHSVDSLGVRRAWSCSQAGRQTGRTPRGGDAVTDGPSTCIRHNHDDLDEGQPTSGQEREGKVEDRASLLVCVCYWMAATTRIRVHGPRDRVVVKPRAPLLTTHRHSTLLTPSSRSPPPAPGPSPPRPTSPAAS